MKLLCKYTAICFVIVGIAWTAWAESPSLRKTPIVLAVEKASPSVVNIGTEKIVRVNGQSQFPSDPFFDQFFRDFLDPFPRRQYTQNSLGSGVLIDKKGYVLTNNHVIQKASKITVTLADNRSFEGKLVGADARSDLAIVKIVSDENAPENLPVASMGISSDLMIGEPVIAIGNPFGLSHTITTGVISALNRSIRIDENAIFRGFIQTDAPINPGNSGGPLINILGDVIGINTAIYSEAQGIGFAIPIDKAKRIIDDLIAYGEVRIAWIGIDVQDITPKIAQYFGYASSDGALISQVVRGSSAEQAGVKPGDIVVAIDENPVRDTQGYATMLADYTVGDTLVFSIIREGKALKISVVAEEFSTEQAAKIAMQRFGIAVADITPEMIDQYRLQSRQGVMITTVQNQSQAFHVGIEPGDIIRQVEGAAIDNLNDFRQAMMKLLDSDSAVFLIQRGSRGYYVTLERQ